MATELETLLVRLEVATAGLESGLNKADTRLVRHAQNVDKTMTRVDKRLEQTQKSFSNFSRNITASLAAGLGAREFIQASDKMLVMENRLRSVTKSSKEYEKISRDLFNVAQSSKQPLNDVVDLYFRLSGALTDAQKAQFPIINLTEKLGKAFNATGVEAQQAQSFILQLSQAAASDFKAVGEEINSLIAAAPILSDAIAKELGLKSASAIKKFAEDGKLNVNNFFTALESATSKLATTADSMAITVEQSLTRLDNAFLNYIGKSELAASGTSTLAAAINGLADNFDILAGAAVTVGGIMATKFAFGIATSTSAIIANTLQSIANSKAQVTNAAMQVKAAQSALYVANANRVLTGSYAGVVGAISTLNAAQTAYQASVARSITLTTALGASFKFLLANPIGLAITGLATAYVLLGDETDAATKFQEENNARIAKAKELYVAINKATGVRAEMLRQEREAELELVKVKLLDAKATFDQALAIERKNIANARGDLSKNTLVNITGKVVDEAEQAYVSLIKEYQDLINIKKTGKTVTEQLTQTESKLSNEINKTSTASNNKSKSIKAANDNLYKTTLENERAAEQADMLAAANSKSEEAYEKLSKKLDIQNKLQQQGFVVGTKLYEINKKHLESINASTEAIEKENEKRQEQAKAAEEYAEAMRRPIENALESIQDTISDTFVGVFDGSVKDAGDAADAIKKIFIRMAAEIATLELFGAGGFNIAGSVRGGILGSVTGGGSQGGGSIVGGLLKEGTSLLGATKIGSAINAFGASALPSIFAPAVAGPTTLAAGLGGAPAAGGLLGGAGIGLSSIALPVAGLAIGALASSVFKKKPKSVASNFGGTIGAQGNLLNEVIRTNGKGDPETAKALSQGVQQVASALIAAGVDVSGQIIQGGVDANRGFIGVGNVDYLTLRNGGAGAINFNPNGGEAAVSEAMAKLALQLTKTSEQGIKFADNLAKIETQGRKAEDVINDISFILGFDGLTKTPEIVTELERTVKDMAAQFDAAAATAERLGLSVDKVREAQEKQMLNLLGGITSDIANQILQLTEPIEAQLQAERNRYAAQIKDLTTVGAKQKDLQMAELLHKLNIEKINESIATKENQRNEAEIERLRVAEDLEKRFANVSSKMKDFLFELTNGQYSPLSPTANLANIRSQVMDLGARARLGDVDAQEKLGELLPLFVQLSGEINGFNANFEADRKIAEDLTRNTITVAERQVSLQQMQISAIQSQTEVTAAGFSGLQAALARTGSGLTASGIFSSAGAGLSAAETWATQYGRSIGKLSANEVAQGGLLASRLTASELEQFNINKRIAGFADGGLVGGVAGVDMNLARLTKGEFVMNNAAVRSVGVNTMQAINSGGGDLIGEIKGLRSDMKQLTNAVVMTGKLNNDELQSISATNARIANLERAVAMRG